MIGRTMISGCFLFVSPIEKSLAIVDINTFGWYYEIVKGAIFVCPYRLI